VRRVVSSPEPRVDLLVLTLSHIRILSPGCYISRFSVITIVNGPYTSDTFVYTAAASTVPPTGNITNPAVPASAGGAGGNTDLGASPTNLQVRTS